MEEGHRGAVYKKSFYSTSSLTHDVRKVPSKTTDLNLEQEQELAVTRVTDEIDVNTAVIMKNGAPKHCMQF